MTADAAGYDITKTLWKGVKTFALATAMQYMPVLLTALTDEQLVDASLRGSGLPAAAVVILTATVVAGGKMLANWWNHRDGARTWGEE